MALYQVSTEPKLHIESLQTGHFISGSSFRALELGQAVEPLDELPGPSARFAADTLKDMKPKAVRPRSQPGGKRGRGVGLQDLMAAGLIQEGKDNIKVVYKGVSYTGSLGSDGNILYQGNRFQSATAFSMYCKRLVTPNKQGDDGWKSVLYCGTSLEHMRDKYHEKYGEEPFSGISKVAAAAQAIEAEAQGMEVDNEGEGEDGDMELADGERLAMEGESSDQWVHCDRCNTWRIVPDEHWQAVQEDKRAHWYCEYADWDVEAFPPRTAACRKK